MRQPSKRKRAERAHRYRVLAQQLDFHLSNDTVGTEVDGCVQSAKRSLLEAATLLERIEKDPSATTATEERQ
jgi:hypothetical protein